MAIAPSGWIAASSSGVGAAGERPDGVGRVEVVVADRVPPRRVGTDEGGVDEERPVAVLLQPVDDRLRTKVVCDSSAGNRAGAQVDPWASAPGNPSIGSYRSCGLDGTSTPGAASQRPHAGLPCSHGSSTRARNPGSTPS